MARRSRKTVRRPSGGDDTGLIIAVGAVALGALLLLSSPAPARAARPVEPGEDLGVKKPVPKVPVAHESKYPDPPPSGEVYLSPVGPIPNKPVRKAVSDFESNGFGSIFEATPGETIVSPVGGYARLPDPTDAVWSEATGRAAPESAASTVIVDRITLSGQRQQWWISSPGMRRETTLPYRVEAGDPIGKVGAKGGSVAVALVVLGADGKWMPVSVTQYL